MKSGAGFLITGFLGVVFVSSLLTDGFSRMPFTGALVKDLHPERVSKVDFFVMSFCPYGEQAESILKPVYDAFKNEVLFEPHYVIYSNYGGGGPNYCLDENSEFCSMHGVNEVKEDVRQLCAWKYYSEDVWWNYVSCINAECSVSDVEGKWESCAQRAGIDVNKIKKCFSEEALQLLAEDKAKGDNLGVSGSPTIFFDGARYSGARTADACKQTLCTSNPDLTGCSSVLSDVSSLPTSGAGCGA